MEMEEVVSVVREAEAEIKRRGKGNVKIMIFEDAAEAFAGPRFTGHPGTDISMFSFGLIKTCTSFGGGILIIRDPVLLASAREIQSRYPEQRESTFVLKVLKYAVFKGLTDSTWAYGLFLVVVERVLGMDHNVVIRKLSRSFDPTTLIAKIKYQPSQLLQILLHHRIRNFDVEILERRRERVEQIFKVLAMDDVRPIGYGLKNHHYWLCPVKARDPKMFERVLYQYGYDCADGGTSLAVLGKGEESKRAREMMKNVVYLPVDYEMSQQEVLRLVGVLRAALGERNGAVR